MAQPGNEIDDIRRKMAQIRVELHEDMVGVVAGTEAATNWQYYVRLYPWAALGASLALGYVIVPRRRRSVGETARRVAEDVAEQIREIPPVDRGGRKSPRVEKEKKKSGVLGFMFGFVGPILMRAAQNYASNYIDQFIAQQRDVGPSPFGSPPGGPSGGGPSGGRPGSSWPS